MNAVKFALILIVVLLAAQISGWPLVDRLVYFLAGMLALAFVLSRLSLHGLRLRREAPATRGQVGGRFVERLNLDNTSWLPRLWVELHDLSSLPDHHASRVLTIGSRGSKTWRVETPLRERGRFQLGPVRLRGGDPFGLFPVERALRGATEVLIYPATLPLTAVPLVDGMLPGGATAHRRTLQATPHVASIRDYTPGDSFNRISWSTTARLGRLMVKEFDLDPTADVWLMLDMQRAAHLPPAAVAPPSLEPWRSSTEEFCITVTASLAAHFLSQQRAVGLLAGGQHLEVIPTDRSPRQLVKLLEALAIIRAEGEQPLGELLLAEAARFTRQSTLVVITPTTDDAWVSALAHSHVRGSAVLVDPATFGGPLSPLLAVGQLAAVGVPSIVLRRDDDLGRVMSMTGPAVRLRPMRAARGGA
jgi:uncharacterized protein (DUF58 family)